MVNAAVKTLTKHSDAVLTQRSDEDSDVKSGLKLIAEILSEQSSGDVSELYDEMSRDSKTSFDMLIKTAYVVQKKL